MLYVPFLSRQQQKIKKIRSEHVYYEIIFTLNGINKIQYDSLILKNTIQTVAQTGK